MWFSKQLYKGYVEVASRGERDLAVFEVLTAADLEAARPVVLRALVQQEARAEEEGEAAQGEAGTSEARQSISEGGGRNDATEAAGGERPPITPPSTIGGGFACGGRLKPQWPGDYAFFS